MAISSILPRVRTVVICDDVTTSSIEEDVFSLQNVRQQMVARSLPWRASLKLFLVLSCPRKGSYSGRIFIEHERRNKSIRLIRFVAQFDKENRTLPLYTEVRDCMFPEPGLYNFQIFFSVPEGPEVLKGEHPFIVLEESE
jgi:hypothetical protein